MKVLFAVNNDEISAAIIKKYQKEFKEILSYKNVYYFNAIIKELQRDKSYDRVVISEDLEPFTSNNYDTIDKFLFEKLDIISDEATDEQGNNTEIVLICNDRRAKADEILVKYFGIGIYSSLIGQDRKIDEVCKLINKPRSKRDAKQYYKIDSESVNYQAEDENNVSEAEVQNILAHYKRLGKDEDRYVDSFNNIVSQYNDNQLKIIISCLPMGVKAVLETKSPKYQELISYSGQTSTKQKTTSSNLNKSNNSSLNVKMLEKDKKRLTKPVVIPSGVNKKQVRKLIKEDEKPTYDNKEDLLEVDEMLNDFYDSDMQEENKSFNEVQENTKKGRGRPKKIVPVELEQVEKEKRGRGRPRKNPIVNETQDVEEEQNEDIDLFGLDNNENSRVSNGNNKVNEKETVEPEVDLFGLDERVDTKESDEPEVDLFSLDESTDTKESDEPEVDLFGLDENTDTKESDEPEVDLFELYEDASSNNSNANTATKDIDDVDDDFETDINEMISTNNTEITSQYNTLLTKDKKVIAFVGTTKNGTSFIVNNLAEMLSSMGIKTAVLDLTKSRNAYYIYTNNEERLRKQAEESIPKLKNGIADGIKANKNLSIYTAIPTENMDYSNHELILSTLVSNYSVVLIDCDFDTPIEYFEKAQELFLVQSMDVLTIQPLTAFLRNLKSKGILKQEKIKVVINKFQKVRNLSAKTLIGGIAFYNDPGMSYMTELFNKDIVPYCIVPFEIQNYVKYLDSLAICSISLNGYTKTLISALKDLANMAYPLINKQTYSPRGEKYEDNFTDKMNNTLSKMKKYQ